MILGIYYKLRIQGSQRAFQPGFAISSATSSRAGHTAKPQSMASLWTELGPSLGSEIEMVAILCAETHPLHTDTHRHLQGLQT